jgi:RNase P subunit RPR2
VSKRKDRRGLGVPLKFMCVSSSLFWGNQRVKRVHEFVADVSCITKMRKQLVSLMIVMHCQNCRMSLIYHLNSGRYKLSGNGESDYLYFICLPLLCSV